MSFAVAIPDSHRMSSVATVPRPLSSVQERRLTDYLDEKILEIQREYKKRNYETSSLRTLSAYINAIRPLLNLILLIPPIEASVHLRASLLLRLTGDILECTPGYAPSTDAPITDLVELLDMLDELDNGWLALLRSQTWNVECREGVDLILPSSTNVRSPPISQTDRTRLRSLLLLGTNKLEQWVEELPMSPSEEKTEEAQSLEVIEALQKFDNLFHQTLSEMGELQGIPAV